MMAVLVWKSFFDVVMVAFSLGEMLVCGKTVERAMGLEREDMLHSGFNVQLWEAWAMG